MFQKSLCGNLVSRSRFFLRRGRIEDRRLGFRVEMGRRKLQIKRIEIEIALVVFAGHGRLYEFCSGESLGNTLDRYQTYVNEEIAAKSTDKPKDLLTEWNALWTGADLLKTIRLKKQQLSWPCI